MLSNPFSKADGSSEDEMWLGFERLHVKVMRTVVERNELLAALKGMVVEFEKFSRYGSPIARDANEAMRAARAAIAKAEAPDGI